MYILSMNYIHSLSIFRPYVGLLQNIRNSSIHGDHMAYVDSIMLIREFFVLHMELGGLICMDGSRGGRGSGPPSWKSTVAILEY